MSKYRVYFCLALLACLFAGSVVSAKVWLLPDYENNDLFKSRNNTKTRPSDPGRECSGYGWKSLASFPSDMECLEEYNGHIKCCRKWRCDPDSYPYDNDNCKPQNANQTATVTGSTCEDDSGKHGTECKILCDTTFKWNSDNCNGSKKPGGDRCTDIINGSNDTVHYSECNCDTSQYPYTSCSNNSTLSGDICEDSVKHYSKCVCDTTIYKYPTQSCSGGNLHGDTCKGSDNVTHYTKCTVCGDCQNWDSSTEQCYVKSCPTGSASDVSNCPNGGSINFPSSTICKYVLDYELECGCKLCDAVCNTENGYITYSECEAKAGDGQTFSHTGEGFCGSNTGTSQICGKCSVSCASGRENDASACGTNKTACSFYLDDVTNGCGICAGQCNDGYYSSTSGCTGTLQANAEWVLKSTDTCGSTTCGTCAQQCKTNFVDTFSHWCAKPATHNCAMLGYSTSVTSCETGTLIKCPFDTSYGVCVGGASGDGGSGGSEDDGCDSSYSLASCPTDQGARSCSECGGKYRIECCASGYTWASWDTCCNMQQNLYHDVVYGWVQTVVGRCYRMESCQHGWMDCYGRSCVQCEDENCGSYNLDNCPAAWNTVYNECAV